MLGKNMGTEKTRAWAVLALVVPLAQSRSLAVQTCIQSVSNLHSTGLDPLFTGSIPAFCLYPTLLSLKFSQPAQIIVRSQRRSHLAYLTYLTHLTLVAALPRFATLR